MNGFSMSMDDIALAIVFLVILAGIAFVAFGDEPR